MGIGQIFPGRPQMDFSKGFPTGSKNGESRFLSLEIKITAFFAEIFKFLPSSDIHMLVCRKRLCQTIKKYE